MYQRMEMNLLAYPKNEEFDIVTAQAYQLMMLLKNAELGIEPYYQTVWKKKDIQLFEFYKNESFQDGCYFCIKDLPINDDSEEDVKLQSYINHLLGLQ